MAEGRKGAATRGEGRVIIEAIELSNEASKRPSRQRVAAPFQAAERRSARRQRFVVAPVGAKNIAFKTTAFARFELPD